MNFTRRDFGKIALASVPLARGFAAINSKFHGVQIGAITYSFRSMPDAEAVIKAMVEIGLGEAELMSNHCEALAGAPAIPSFGRGGGGGRGRGAGGGRAPLTPEQQAQLSYGAGGIAKGAPTLRRIPGRASARSSTRPAVLRLRCCVTT